MLRTVNPQQCLWDAILPKECLGLPPGLAEGDQLLDDSRVFEPFQPFFQRHDRPAVGPDGDIFAVVFLKYRYRLGFEATCAEVVDSIT